MKRSKRTCEMTRLTAIIHMGLIVSLVSMSGMSNAWAESKSQATYSIDDNRKNLNRFVDTEIELTRQVSQGLVQLQTICNRAAKTGSISIEVTPADLAIKEKIAQNIQSAKAILENQKKQTALSINRFKAKTETSELKMSCGALPSFLRLSSNCIEYTKSSALVETVSKSANTYYEQVSERLNDYDTALTMESQGCTRTGFAQRLWNAEESHMLPKLKSSSSFFDRTLNSK